jgi:hypothetical protein
MAPFVGSKKRVHDRAALQHCTLQNDLLNNFHFGASKDFSVININKFQQRDIFLMLRWGDYIIQDWLIYKLYKEILFGKYTILSSYLDER